MTQILLPTTMTPEAYLAWELEQDTKHEYEYGEIIAMTGGKLDHNEITITLITLIHNHLLGQGCWVLGCDAKVMPQMGVFYYPDVVVSCDDRDRPAREFLQYPCLIAEVLSPSTESRDRGQKFQNYRQMDTLQEYLIIDCDRPSIEIYRRNQNNNWELIHIFSNQPDFATTNPQIDLTSINLHFSLAELYQNIEFLP